MENEWIDIFHNKEYCDRKPCNKLAFRYRGSFEPDTVLSAENIQWPDGRMAESEEVFRCGSCGMLLWAGSLTEDGIG